MAKMKLKTPVRRQEALQDDCFRQDQAQRVQAPPYPDQEDHQAHRGLRMPKYVDKTNEATVRKMMPYGG